MVAVKARRLLLFSLVMKLLWPSFLIKLEPLSLLGVFFYVPRPGIRPVFRVGVGNTCIPGRGWKHLDSRSGFISEEITGMGRFFV